MTDYEIVDLMQSHIESLGALGTYLITGVFGFIIACYVAGKKMNTLAFIGLVSIYLPYATMQILGIYSNLTRLHAIISEAASRQTLTEEIEVFSESSMVGADIYVPFMMSYWVFAVIASLIFGLAIQTGRLRL